MFISDPHQIGLTLFNGGDASEVPLLENILSLNFQILIFGWNDLQ